MKFEINRLPFNSKWHLLPNNKIMKKFKLLYLLILPFVISSCDFLDKFDHFGVGNTFEESLTVNTPPGPAETFSGSVDFAASDDATLGDNLQDIQEFDITKISLRITKYTGDDSVFANGDFTFSYNGLVVGVPVVIDNLIFSQAESTGQEFILPLTSVTYKGIKEAYLNNQPITITIAGVCSASETDVEIEFTMYMEIAATINN